jgi:hypothetical protein
MKTFKNEMSSPFASTIVEKVAGKKRTKQLDAMMFGWGVGKIYTRKMMKEFGADLKQEMNPNLSRSSAICSSSHAVSRLINGGNVVNA